MVSPSMAELRLESKDATAERSDSGETANAALSGRRRISRLVDPAVWIYSRTRLGNGCRDGSAEWQRRESDGNRTDFVASDQCHRRCATAEESGFSASTQWNIRRCHRRLRPTSTDCLGATCGVSDIAIRQRKTGATVEGKPEYEALVSNKCRCPQSKVVLRCYGLSSVEAVDRRAIRAVDEERCIVADGRP
ncbi:hypothetical protein MUK42_07353, partial [Musa troglodytarum]